MKISILKKATSVMFFAAFSSAIYGAVDKNINFTVPAGIPEMTILQMKNEPNPKSDILTYTIEKNSANLINSVLKGEPDFAIVPSNIVERISEKELPYSVLGTAGWGSFYLVGYNSIKSPNDLSGEKILINGKGLTPDLISTALLKKKGVEKLDFEYLNTPNDVAFMLLGKKADYGILPEPVLSEVLKKNPDLKILLDFNELWKTEFHSKHGYPQSTLIVKNSFYNDNRELSNEIIKKYAASIDYLNSNPDAAIYNDFNLTKEKAERMNLDFIPGKDSVGTYKIFLEVIGGRHFNDKIFK